MSTWNLEAFQRIVNEPEPDDDQPAAVTSYQAMKCAAILGAVLDGHVGYTETAASVVRFLQAAVPGECTGTWCDPAERRGTVGPDRCSPVAGSRPIPASA